jgi:hypothetical protein
MENLKNNSESMKTVVETFLIEETVDLIYDGEKLEKWNNLVSELGLSGQSKIAKPEKSPIPFLHLKKSLVEVFHTLCPRSVNIKEFNSTPIPVEILGLVSLSEREQYFGSVQVWFDDKNPDPACVGVVETWILHKKGSYTEITGTFTNKIDAESYILANGIEADVYHKSWEDNFYLIGKWADMKHSLEELKQMAVQRFIAEQGNQYNKQIKEAQRKLADIETDAFDKFN